MGRPRIVGSLVLGAVLADIALCCKEPTRPAGVTITSLQTTGFDNKLLVGLVESDAAGTALASGTAQLEVQSGELTYPAPSGVIYVDYSPVPRTDMSEFVGEISAPEGGTGVFTVSRTGGGGGVYTHPVPDASVNSPFTFWVALSTNTLFLSYVPRGSGTRVVGHADWRGNGTVPLTMVPNVGANVLAGLQGVEVFDDAGVVILSAVGDDSVPCSGRLAVKFNGTHVGAEGTVAATLADRRKSVFYSAASSDRVAVTDYRSWVTTYVSYAPPQVAASVSHLSVSTAASVFAVLAAIVLV